MEMHTGPWQGTCGFRLTPDDDLAVAPSSAQVGPEAIRTGWSLRYTWAHPQDGEQAGVLLVGGPDEEGRITAAWLDSWHQRPQVRLLVGTSDATTTMLETDYDGWRWRILVTTAPGSLGLIMHNVVPDGSEGMNPGPYVVMEARWSPVAG